jgi:hypothetical protein
MQDYKSMLLGSKAVEVPQGTPCFMKIPVDFLVMNLCVGIQGVSTTNFRLRRFCKDV